MREIPMFPLGTAIVPGQPITLQVFEPRYLQMIERCLDGDGRFGVVLIERGSEVGGGEVRFEVGTVAKIVDVAELPGGRIGVHAVGEARLRVLEWLEDDPYPRALVDERDEDGAGFDASSRRADLDAAFARVLDAARALGADVGTDLRLTDDPIGATWSATAMAPLGPMDVLAILREDDPVRRMDRVIIALTEAAELLELRRTHG